MEVDPPAVEAFVFEGLPGSAPKPKVPAAPVISREEQEKRDLAAYFPTFRPGRHVNFTDLLGYGGDMGAKQSDQYMEDPMGDQNRRRKVVDLDGKSALVSSL
jgi:hypothetical protein